MYHLENLVHSGRRALQEPGSFCSSAHLDISHLRDSSRVLPGAGPAYRAPEVLIRDTSIPDVIHHDPWCTHGESIRSRWPGRPMQPPGFLGASCRRCTPLVVQTRSRHDPTIDLASRTYQPQTKPTLHLPCIQDGSFVSVRARWNAPDEAPPEAA